MQEPPRPGRGRSRRRRSQRPRPTQAPAEPQQRVQPPAPRDRQGRDGRRGDQRGAQQQRPDRARQDRGARRGRGRPRQPAGERTGTPAVILLDNREGEPDLTGAAAIFEGWFDPETGDRRRPGDGMPRLKAGNDRLWGFECWWRADPTGGGLTPEDHAELETSKKLLRGLIRDARRPPAFGRRPTAT